MNTTSVALILNPSSRSSAHRDTTQLGLVPHDSVLRWFPGHHENMSV